MREWEKNIRKVVPYVPGEQPKKKGIIKLNTNENPYPPANGVKEALKNMDYDTFRLYPAPDCEPLVQTIADYYGLKNSQVFTGVGSDDVIAMAFMTFFNSDKPIVFPEITYSFYDVWADLLKIPYVTTKLDDNFRINREDYYAENGGVIFPNPNAPTGVGVELSFIEDVLRHNQDVIVMIDEAYIDFGCESALSLIDTYENLLIIQTFSKSRSMAGMRIGYAMGNEVLIKALNDVKYSFNSYTMNTPSIILGKAAIEDREYFESTVEKIVNTRENAKKRLAELGFIFEDSKSNFIFARHKTKKATDIFEYLKSKDIYVRHFSKESINNYLRISIGTDQEMEVLYKALEEYL